MVHLKSKYEGSMFIRNVASTPFHNPQVHSIKAELVHFTTSFPRL
jgi:hypothetical protein